MEIEPPKHKSGTNIVQMIDYNALSQQFIIFFYEMWSSNPQALVSILYEHSRLLITGKIYKSVEIISALEVGLKFDIKHLSCMDSGSRRIDILVHGFIIKESKQIPFSQSFVISHSKESWKLHNSMINIFI
jgi:glycosyltransferase involved in cell wall biosynthesis